MTTISDNLIDRAAQAIWDENMQSMPDDTMPPWADAHEDDQDDYRDLARAALSIIAPTVDQLRATIRDLETLAFGPSR